MGKAKFANKRKQDKEFIHSFPQAGRCSASPGEQCSITHSSNLGRQTPSHPFLLFGPTLYTEHSITWSGVSLWSVLVTCSGCFSSQSPMHPPTLSAWLDKSKKGLGCMSALLSSKNPSLCYHTQIQITALCQLP